MRSYKLYPLAIAILLMARRMMVGFFALACSAHAAPIGEVTLTIGQAMLVAKNGQSSPVLRGTKINSGDRIETSEGGHVHIRFVDGALVSVRPTSRLIVEDYHYDVQQVERSLVRFRLEKGVMRAISGAAAEGAKDRFRLNTPLVAIGVKGTDFVVKSESNQTIAMVNQGAIVMTPFGEGCSSGGNGPCGSISGKLLSADMRNMLVEFKSSSLQVELKPFGVAKTSEVILASADARSIIETASTQQAPKSTNSTISNDTAGLALVQSVVRTAGDLALEPGVPTSPASPLSPMDAGIPTVPSLPVTPVASEPAQLVWGRWAGAAFDAGDFSVARLDARQGRTVTVGDSNFILYRTENGATTISRNLGNINFGLQQAYARFTSPALEALPATVLGGQLSIDFASRQFNTSLSLSSGSTSPVSFQASGVLRDDGLFTSRGAAQSLAGAAAFDGKSAGYLFEKAVAGGTFSGITLWSR